MKFRRMPIEIESPEQMGYDNVRFNLTESSVTDRHLAELITNVDNIPLSYGDHLGLPELRNILVKDFPGLKPEHVITTTGAASALFIVASSLMNKGDHCVVINPNYITNIETPRLIGVELSCYDLEFDKGFEINPRELEDLITPKTKLISLTFPHNPTGKCIDGETLKTLVGIAEKHDCFLLLDETYRDMQFNGFPPLAAELSDRCISVSSLSKTYGLPGIRSGWIITQNTARLELFLAAKEQIFVTGSLLDEYLSYKFLEKKELELPRIHKHILHNKNIVKDWIESSEFFEWIEPEGGCVCFPRVKTGFSPDMEKLYEILNTKYETYVGPGHWFECSKRYFRLGFGYPLEDELRSGIENLEKAMKETLESA